MNHELDHSFTVFSSEGKLKQCDHALQAALNGSLSAGASAFNGCVLSSLKNLPLLVRSELIWKVNSICPTIGMTYAGLQPDYRILYDKAVRMVEVYKDAYGRYPYLDVFVHNFCLKIQEYTQKGGLRPFGVMILICGPILQNDTIKPALYQIDTSGSFQMLKVGSVGKDSDNARKFVERRLESVDDNIFNCVGAIREFAGFSIGPTNVDIGVYFSDKNVFKVYSREEVNEVFDSILVK
ncbi:subunit of proteasome [Hamiltosporidium magnivora]|uniref:Subunit of proteasome n=1 Tax=Hamiltosporidium magnivora TaxID=148818 RepID=A0A4Q9KZ18_9MICR|nr:subunit of proteasome [Hamiltosporidium magnivora]